MQLDSAGRNAAFRRPGAPIDRNEGWNAGNFHFPAQKQKKPENGPKNVKY